jgi:hypothetical protein
MRYPVSVRRITLALISSVAWLAACGPLPALQGRTAQGQEALRGAALCADGEATSSVSILGTNEAGTQTLP